jgi:hypothetical protein
LLSFENIGLRNWLINAFNGEWLRVPHARPQALQALGEVEKRKL